MASANLAQIGILAPRNSSERSFVKPDDATGRTLNTILENLVAELTVAAYVVALRLGAGNPWLDLELELWHALTDATSKWNREAHRPPVAWIAGANIPVDGG